MDKVQYINKIFDETEWELLTKFYNNICFPSTQEHGTKQNVTSPSREWEENVGHKLTTLTLKLKDALNLEWIIEILCMQRTTLGETISL